MLFDFVSLNTIAVDQTPRSLGSHPSSACRFLKTDQSDSMFGIRKKDKNRSLGYVRGAHHSGSWYEDSSVELNKTLSTYLEQASQKEASNPSSPSSLRGLVAPHAGFSYSGPTAAFAYRALAESLASSDETYRHIIVLHPAHHVYLDGCAVSGATELETPIANLLVDDEIRTELLATNKFSVMEKSTDEQEHSGEMQYPFIAMALKKANKLQSVKVLPIMVGAIDTIREQSFGKLLAPILARPSVVCAVSSDFCHWGTRFRYQPVSSSGKRIFEHIEEMDRAGMKHIEMQDPGAFAYYLKQTSNTICGRHPIAVWLNAVQSNREAERESLDIKFVMYNQSSKVEKKRDSSVSYASAVARITAEDN